MSASSRKVALAFLAHPDDAEFLCAGTLIRLSQAGWQVHVATAAPGDCGTVDRTPWDISAIRTAEAQAAAKLIGATYHCLDERDLMIVFDKPTLRKTIDLFRRIAPSLVFTHFLDDYMSDHREVSELARAASFAHGAPNASQFPLIEGTGVPHLYYCDAVEAVDTLGRPVEPTTVIDIAAQMELKTRMLACHASQREWLRAYHGTDEYLDAMRRHAALRGPLAGSPAAEVFIQHRGHAYPRNDLLAELLPRTVVV